MSWTDERIERLKAMWAEGSTASQIAEELGGVSRNAVIGKAHRLGLESRPSPVKPGEEKEKARPRPPPRPSRRAQAAPPAPKAAPRRPRPSRAAARRVKEAAGDADMPVAPMHRPSGVAAKEGNTIQYRSVGPGGFIRQGPGDTQAPIPPAPPRRLVPAKPSPRSPTRPACSTSTTASAAGRWAIRASPTSTSAASAPTPAIPIASTIAASPTRRSCRAATAARRRPCPSAARASARKKWPRKHLASGAILVADSCDQASAVSRGRRVDLRRLGLDRLRIAAA